MEPRVINLLLMERGTVERWNGGIRNERLTIRPCTVFIRKYKWANWACALATLKNMGCEAVTGALSTSLQVERVF